MAVRSGKGEANQAAQGAALGEQFGADLAALGDRIRPAEAVADRRLGGDIEQMGPHWTGLPRGNAARGLSSAYQGPHRPTTRSRGLEPTDLTALRIATGQ
jgi:hypothetical protein